MSNIEIPTCRLKWEVAKHDESAHRACPSDTMQEMVNQDWDGNPINTAIQDDAAAYINKLVEGIDNEIR